MIAYVVRRLAYGLVTLVGVLFFLFVLFFAVTTPDDVARRAVGDKALPQAIEQWKANHGYDRPLWPSASHPTDNLLVDHFRRMLTLDFGKSDADGVLITQRISEGAGPSLTLTVPLFVLGVALSLWVSLWIAYLRGTYVDRTSTFVAVLMMSVPLPVYIIFGQFFFAKVLRWFPVSGFDPNPAVLARFLFLPVLIGLLASTGSDIRFFRAVFAEQMDADYVRTARAKGARESRILFRHVLPNAMIPIITNVVLAIPFLFTGSLLLEAGFGIPGLGSLTVEAVNANDFSTLRAMVFLGSLLFVLGQLLTDLCYAWADPRVRLG